VSENDDEGGRDMLGQSLPSMGTNMDPILQVTPIALKRLVQESYIVSPLTLTSCHFVCGVNRRLGETDHMERLACLEAEQEQLNSSLLALTTHFAQVQFRLKQIVAAEPNLKEVGIDFASKVYTFLIYVNVIHYAVLNSSVRGKR